jgi:hypothetical protein
MDGSPFQVTLNGLSQLEDLYVQSYRDIAEFGHSCHPHLRTFTFVGETLPSSFLNRHPTIECLRLRVTDGCTLGDGDLPRLKVLFVNWKTILNIPGLLSPSACRPITHLQVNYVFSEPMPANILPLVGNIHATLRHLILVWPVDEFRQHIAECFPLFRVLTQLEELTTRPHSEYFDEILCEDDLVSFIDSTSIL